MTGFSLPVVLFVMGLGGALAAGGAFVSRQMSTSSRAVSRSAALDGLAEQGLVSAVASLTPADGAQAIGSTTELAAVPSVDAVTRRWLTRSDTSVYWIVAEVRTMSKPLLWRRLGVVVQRRDSIFALVQGRAWSDLH